MPKKGFQLVENSDARSRTTFYADGNNHVRNAKESQGICTLMSKETKVSSLYQQIRKIEPVYSYTYES